MWSPPSCGGCGRKQSWLESVETIVQEEAPWQGRTYFSGGDDLGSGKHGKFEDVLEGIVQFSQRDLGADAAAAVAGGVKERALQVALSLRVQLVIWDHI